MIRFGSLGSLGTVLNYTVLIVAAELLQLNEAVASSLGYFSGAALSFWLSHRFVFDSDSAVLGSSLRFLSITAFGGLLYVTVFTVCNLQFHYIFAQIVATVFIFFVNFYLAKYWVFK